MFTLLQPDAPVCNTQLFLLPAVLTDNISNSAGSARHSPERADAHQQPQDPATDPAPHPNPAPTQSDTPTPTPTASGQQPGSSQLPSDDSVLASPQKAAQSSCDDSSMAPHVPPELRALTTWLRGGERLRTTGLFVNSTDAAMLWAMHQPADKAAADSNREPKGGCALAVKHIREALDRGQQVSALSSPFPLFRLSPYPLPSIPLLPLCSLPLVLCVICMSGVSAYHAAPPLRPRPLRNWYCCSNTPF